MVKGSWSFNFHCPLPPSALLTLDDEIQFQCRKVNKQTIKAAETDSMASIDHLPFGQIDTKMLNAMQQYK